MNVHVLTDTPDFLNDIGDVLRVFFGDVTLIEEEAPDAFTHRVSADGGAYVDTWTHLGQSEALESRAEGHPLTVKRMRKRAVKQCLYRLLKRETGLTPPWGALTGIRPTRLLYEGMEMGLSTDEAIERVIREFDVSRDRARLLGDIAEMQRGLLFPADDEFDLYIGIPFCVTRCSYCSFASGEIGDGRLVEPYVNALLREIRLCGDMIRTRGLRLRAGYIGGGTPTAIPCGALERILAAAQETFPGAVEWTVEAGRPDTIDREKLDMLRRHGVGRISVNPQTFQDETLRRIGRAHTAQDTLDAFALAREAGFDDINMDLITALPGETSEDFNRTLDQVLALEPESVTVHTLAIKRSSRLHEQMVVSGDSGAQRVAADADDDMVDTARRRLTEAGWRPYYLYRQKYMAANRENVGYAKPGKACLYNIGNMEETVSVLALGAGAISKWLFDRTLRIERAPNVRNIEEYIRRVDEMAARKRAVIFSDKGAGAQEEAAT